MRIAGQVPLHGTKNNNGERGGVLGGVGEVLPAPADALLVGRGADAQVLNQTLTQTDEIGQGHEERDEDAAAAVAVRAIGGGAGGAVEEHHAEADKQVAEDLGVRGEDVGEEDVAEFAVGGLGDAADADALEGREEAAAAGVGEGEAAEGEDEERGEHEEVGHGHPVIVDDEGWVAVGEEPEGDEGEGECRGEDGGEAVGREVVRRVGGGGS